jgi:hypothetical protein
MFDLDKLSMKETVDLHLRHPVSEELLYADEAKTKPVVIVLQGTSSKQYRNAITAMQNRALKRGKKQASAEVMREEGIELLVACSEKAVNFSYQGKSVEDDAAFRSLYGDAKFSWLKDQVDTGLGDVSNFLEA